MYSISSINAAEIFYDSEDLIKFAGNQARRYHEARLTKIFEPIFPFEGILDIPGLLLTPAVFAYYLITGSFLYKNKTFQPNKNLEENL